MSKRNQPTWQPPTPSEQPTKPRLYNSLTRQKEEFVPTNGNNVSWYSCGPTVYDASHMGHARSYISFDILRRVMTDYFGYNVLYVMNITDIDDKIIKRARQNYLYEEYVAASKPLEQILDDHKHVLNQLNDVIEKNTDPDKKVLLDRSLQQMTEANEKLTAAVSTGDSVNIADATTFFLSQSKDALSDWLDRQKGSAVSENSIFETLPRYWENEFHKDMEALNILPPDVLTRVSEYVPKIVSYIEQIISNGLAYESNGSVYFDVSKFDSQEHHYYAKLVPEAYGDTKSLQEGEGDLCISEDRLSEKRSPNDFALWKLSKPGEPWWQSPWGHGRPGWHIECSAMASDICGQHLDIHTGGVDLKFPHHDNELAQSEAHFDSAEWVKYFLHTGHLTIAGCKMSKSLKNFITIQEALKKQSACELRLMFLLHSWKDTLDYSDNTMDMAVQYKKFMNEFFLNVKDLLRQQQDSENPGNQFQEWTSAADALQKKFDQTKTLVHAALCDNVDTRTVLHVLRELVTQSNIYVRDNSSANGVITTNGLLLKRIALYITDILHIFGAIQGPRGGIGFPIDTNSSDNIETTIMPYLSALAEFRKAVRESARIHKCTEILKLCDAFRDDILPNLGVRLEDREGAASSIKLISRETLLKEREAKKLLEAQKQAAKEKKRKETEAAAAALEAQRKVSPKDMFLHENDKYSAFDERGIPTLDASGEKISKGLTKKLEKLQIAQEKKYNEYLATLSQQ